MKTAVTIAPGETIAVEPAGHCIAFTISSGLLTIRRELSCDTASVLACGLEMVLSGHDGSYGVKLTTLERITLAGVYGGVNITLKLPVVGIQRLITLDTARALMYGLEKAMEAADCAAARAAARAAA